MSAKRWVYVWRSSANLAARAFIRLFNFTEGALDAVAETTAAEGATAAGGAATEALTTLALAALALAALTDEFSEEADALASPAFGALATLDADPTFTFAFASGGDPEPALAFAADTSEFEEFEEFEFALALAASGGGTVPTFTTSGAELGIDENDPGLF